VHIVCKFPEYKINAELISLFFPKLNFMFTFAPMENRQILRRLFRWKEDHVRHRRFVILMSLVVGVLGGLAAVLLKNTVHFTQELLTHHLKVDRVNWYYFVFPMLGLLLTVLYVKFFVKDNISHGVSRILYAISKKNSIIRGHNTFSSMIASTLTVGFGGSVGLEAPIVLTGSAIGSNLSRILKLNYKTTTLMLGCGAAAALAGIFKAPIAALIFALEVLMLDLTMWSIIPLMLSAVTGAVVSYFLLGKGVIFSFSIVEPFVMNNIPFYVVLGIISGFVSLYVTRGVKGIEKLSSRIKNPYEKLIIGGSVLGCLIFLFPPLFGEGYTSLKALLTGNAGELLNGSFFFGLSDNYWIFIAYLILILLFKVLAMSVTTGGGGVGGIFAPALFMGGITGYIVSSLIGKIGIENVSEKNFTLVGMAGIMAGVLHAPLTAVFLIAEITGGYALFIPLIITTAISYITIMYFEPHSIYTERLARRGELITHHKDNAVLTLLNIKSVIEKDLKPIDPESTLGDLVKIISKSKRNIFPVVDKDQVLHGIILLDDIRDIIFNQEMYHSTIVTELMISPPAIVDQNEAMNSVMEKFEETQVWNLPVVDGDKYVGFISKARIFNVYRKLLVQFSDE
jgi:CIC family chloride channel protein